MKLDSWVALAKQMTDYGRFGYNSNYSFNDYSIRHYRKTLPEYARSMIWGDGCQDSSLLMMKLAELPREIRDVTNTYDFGYWENRNRQKLIDLLKENLDFEKRSWFMQLLFMQMQVYKSQPSEFMQYYSSQKPELIYFAEYFLSKAMARKSSEICKKVGKELNDNFKFYFRLVNVCDHVFTSSNTAAFLSFYSKKVKPGLQLNQEHLQSIYVNHNRAALQTLTKLFSSKSQWVCLSIDRISEIFDKEKVYPENNLDISFVNEFLGLIRKYANQQKQRFALTEFVDLVDTLLVSQERGLLKGLNSTSLTMFVALLSQVVDPKAPNNHMFFVKLLNDQKLENPIYCKHLEVLMGRMMQLENFQRIRAACKKEMDIEVSRETSDEKQRVLALFEEQPANNPLPQVEFSFMKGHLNKENILKSLHDVYYSDNPAKLST